jgi:hypothetical protein
MEKKSFVTAVSIFAKYDRLDSSGRLEHEREIIQDLIDNISLFK